MTLSGDRYDKKKRQQQNRTQRIVMWSIFAVAGILLVIAVVLFIVSGAPLF
jgi:uncharacterized membrane protein